ncbi:MAG: NAD-dependent DNA ligase [Elusimicrobia bacterium]|nr:NAD-dependent DNA ligase [Elusimicrobiota bacterium]
MRAYQIFATKHVILRALHHLEGLIDGIAADRTVDCAEVLKFREWLNDYAHLKNRLPFQELFMYVEKAVADGILTEEEIEDIRWLCKKIDSELIPSANGDIQRLHGLLQGIIADHVLSVEELEKLEFWLNEHEVLKGCWPYDEICSLLVSLKKDKILGSEQHATLMKYFSDFSQSETKVFERKSISGICACDPQINIAGSEFCFTGESHKGISRAEIAKKVLVAGGIFQENLRKSADYLVVGSEANPYWFYACYGRKIEKAQNWRRAGHKVCIVHENDLWDALADAGYE